MKTQLSKPLKWSLIFVGTIGFVMVFCCDFMVTGNMSEQEMELEAKKEALERRIREEHLRDPSKPSLEDIRLEEKSYTLAEGTNPWISGLSWLICLFLLCIPSTLIVYGDELQRFLRRHLKRAAGLGIGSVLFFLFLIFGILFGAARFVP